MEYKFKIIVLGNFSSGKTSIVKRLKDESFYDTYSSTLGVDFLKKNFEHQELFNDTMTFEDGSAAYEISKENRLAHFKSNDAKFKKYHNLLDKTRREDITYSLAIWDTSGQEKFTSITTAYFRRVTACVLVFDITNFSSFTSIQTWHRDLINQITESERAHFPLVLVGNKADLAKKRAVPTEDAIKLAEQLGCSYVECSAKDNIKINEIFAEIVRNITFKINHELICPSIENGINVLNNEQDLFPRYEFKLNEQKDSQKCCSIM
jgi:small GTP-binding protein